MLIEIRWDEWVPESRVLKMNEENLIRQAELKASMATKKKVAVEKKINPNDPQKDAKKKRRESMQEKV